MGLDITKKVFGGVVIEIGPWVGDTPPTYPTDYFDPGDVKKFTEALKTEKIEDFTWYTGEKTLMVQDVVSKGYEITMELGQIDQNALSIAYMGTTVGSNEIQPLTQPLGVFAVKVTPKYPRGENWVRHYWKVSLLMTGSLDLISDKYMSLTLSGSGLIDNTYHYSNPYFSVVLATE
jgi:hypothetical protein